MKPLAVIRSLIFYVGYALFVSLFSVLSCTLGYALPIKQRQTLATTGNYLVQKWLTLTCGIRVKVIGAENIPAEPVVILSNHQSPWETYYLQRKHRPVSTILKRELLKIPFFGWGLASVKPIAIDRTNPRQALKDVMTQGKERLESGMNVVVYPEGTRIPFGETGTYARSGAALAVAAGVPVLPVAHNAGRLWPSKQLVKYPGTITIAYGEPISSSGGDSKAITQQARAWITETQSKIG
jgi:1-acyl-sn-glycerol-3-phosphate acyltransferase